MSRPASAFCSAPPLTQSDFLSKPVRCCKANKQYDLASARSRVLRAQLSSVDGIDEVGSSAGNAPGAAPKTVWSRAPMPVYSACTHSSEVGRGNMNVLTYCTPLGLGSTPKWAVALYVGTLTWTSVKQLGIVRLALMSEGHAPLIGLFGKTSGRVVDKMAEAALMGFNVKATEDGVPYLADSPGYIDLEVNQWVECGDHELAICSTVSTVELTSIGADRETPVLTTGKLRDMGILDPL